MAVTIEVDGDLIDWLVAVQWLPQAEIHERDQIARAIEALLRDAARG
jgi:hypothetical protein